MNLRMVKYRKSHKTERRPSSNQKHWPVSQSGPPSQPRDGPDQWHRPLPCVCHPSTLSPLHCSLCTRRSASAKAAGAAVRSARNCAVNASARCVSHHASKVAACAWNHRTSAGESGEYGMGDGGWGMGRERVERERDMESIHDRHDERIRMAESKGG